MDPSPCPEYPLFALAAGSLLHLIRRSKCVARNGGDQCKAHGGSFHAGLSVKLASRQEVVLAPSPYALNFSLTHCVALTGWGDAGDEEAGGKPVRIIFTYGAALLWTAHDWASGSQR